MNYSGGLPAARAKPSRSVKPNAILPRVLWMCLMASTRGGLVYSAYVERFAQSRRTWNRDLARIEAAGVPIIYDREYNRYVADRSSIANEFRRAVL